MATPLSYMQRMQLAQKTRERFLADAQKLLVELGGLVQDRLTALLNERGTTRDMQNRRDAWMLFQKQRGAWIDGTMTVWQEALKSPAGKKLEKKKDELSLEGDGGLSLVGTDAVENKILASRLVLAVVEKVGSELDDLRVRIKTLENRDDLEGHDLLRPEVLILLMVEQWTTCGMPRESWPMVAEVVQKHLIEKLKVAYANGNEFLIQQGVMPTIDLKDRVKRGAVGRRPPPPPGAPPQDPMAGGDSQLQGDPGSGGWASGPAPAYGPAGAQAYPQSYPSQAYGAGQAVVSAPAPLGAGQMPMARGPAGGGASMPPPQPAYPGQPSAPAGMPAGRGSGGQLFGGRLGWDDGGAVAPPSRPGRMPGVGAGGTSSMPAALGQTPAQMHQAMAQGAPSQYGGTHEETRLLTQTTPLARTRSRAQGMFGQLKRLLVGVGAGDFSATSAQPPSPALAAAIAERPQYAGGSAGGGTGTVYEDFSPAGVVKVAEKLREKTDELKKKAETKSEKAIIEMVALMFQAILAEERIPTTIRVWFARLQMPVLRVALGDPEFFGSINHPARQLIDRMGSCVLGFDATGISGSALEAEIKRIVQVIEQYPETGKRVFQIVYDEFQKFLSKYLTGKQTTQKVVSVAQQVEQKETLTIQYTIEMRNLLKDIPVRDEIRTFLFKVWAEVLAVSAVRKGPKDAETVALKKAAADLVWSASAKPNRNDRARVIQDLPQLLQRLRSGMSLLGTSPTDQDAHIKIVSDTMADAFMSKTQAIPQAQIDAMTQRLANLEDFVSEDGLGDLPLDAESIEMMLGIDASTIDVVTNGGSKPTPAMVAWAQELQPGSWFTLDHNGKVNQVQFVWRSDRKHLNLFASSDGHSYLIQAGRLAAYLQAGLLLPQEEETLTVRATREALTRLEANPERLVA
ncbi:MAG: DUF1631 family protein [Hylemonella sp.]|uniref:DUF1631 family protein n=1 Tax=Hylemonella sp. TaxID=2066020 RepID=UPI0022BFDF00|nr:DUF1631 family protein [Hylemonella sp.]MCZ8252937.1 DUF1631 family protein [Hylemonella sp.]